MSKNIYNFNQIESKWINSASNYTISNNELYSKKKYYSLVMLPYPSGKLHMGHIRNYTIGDVVARIKKMQGYAVINPMGWDSFGMPAENAAIQNGGHPEDWTLNNIQEMKTQLKKLGYMYDWNREVSTCSKEYYVQEQKIFLDMYKHGLVYRKESYVNWDPVDKTVLANEQVIDGKGWRSGALVEKKLLKQWSIKITDYAEELLNGLNELKRYWPEKVIKMQENWIGKSEGALINFKLENTNDYIEVYSTRPDTLFGASFIAISPDHNIAKKMANQNLQVKEFINECKKIGTTEEMLEKAEKKGYFTGLYVDHPLIQNKKLPVYIANFVLIDYGTGAVFGCPAHDERDYEFAIKYDLPIIPVIKTNEKLPYTGDGLICNSEYIDGLSASEAKTIIIEKLEKLGIGKKKTTYRLRDWLVSRQRYWGCPIPIIHCNKCGEVPAELPVFLPEDIDFKSFKGNPLESHSEWKKTKCPKCGETAVRDTDTLDTFVDSSWYFIRYLDPHSTQPINKEITDYSLPVDMYIGGVEHAVLHLLYARFFMLVLRDLGYVSGSIPFKCLLTQGMVCHKLYKNSDGNWVYPNEVEKLGNGQLIDSEGKQVTEYSAEKMSKSKKNIINPQDIMDTYGIDALRLFILSDTPPDKDFEWNTDALDGSWRFMNRVWKVLNKIKDLISNNNKIDDSLIKITHIYIKKIEENYDSLSLNKAIALAREFFNKIEDKLEISSKKSLIFAFESFVKLFYPITPFICHEIWEQLGHNTILSNESWPEYDNELTQLEVITIAIQVNGKLRKTIDIYKDMTEELIKKKAIESLGNNIDVNKIKKLIVVPQKVVNIVT